MTRKHDFIVRLMYQKIREIHGSSNSAIIAIFRLQSNCHDSLSSYRISQLIKVNRMVLPAAFPFGQEPEAVEGEVLALGARQEVERVWHAVAADLHLNLTFAAGGVGIVFQVEL